MRILNPHSLSWRFFAASIGNNILIKQTTILIITKKNAAWPGQFSRQVDGQVRIVRVLPIHLPCRPVFEMTLRDNPHFIRQQRIRHLTGLSVPAMRGKLILLYFRLHSKAYKVAYRFSINTYSRTLDPEYAAYPVINTMRLRQRRFQPIY